MSAVGAFFGRLFGTDRAVEKVVDTATTLLDEAFYTDEEKAVSRAEARREAQGMVVEWMNATSGSRLARRVIAFMITGTWLFQHTMSTLMLSISVWTTDRSLTGKLMGSSELLDARSAEMQSAVLLILGFYFAAPYMGDIAKSALTKFGGGK